MSRRPLGPPCMRYHRIWTFSGPNLSTVLRERHDSDCDCLYCRTFAASGRAGIEIPACKHPDVWRIIWWRWKRNLHVLRWTLPSGEVEE